MDEQRELKKDLTSIQGAIKTQDGIYIPLSEVERLLMNRITQVKKCSIPDVSKCYTEQDMDNAYDKGFKDGNQRDFTI